MSTEKQKDKREFINNEILASSILGGLTRGFPVYKTGIKESVKNEFRNFLKDILKKYAQSYKVHVGSKQHIKNIEKFADKISERHKEILNKDRFRIGRAQKVLNLYLKYLWVLHKIPRPPHCPFDSIIIEKLKLKEKINWTQFDSIKKYEILVGGAKKKAQKENLSIAEWELKEWNKIVKK